MPESSPLPVTLISGFAGAGKSSLVQHLLAHCQGRRLGVLANAELGAAQGCLCCSASDELRREVRRLAAGGSCDYLLIESSAAAEPQRVAELFTFEDEHGEGLSDVARLDTLVTVIDVESFLSDWQSEDDLRARGAAVDEDDERSVSDVLAEQIEFANVLVLGKLDRVSEEEAARVEALLRQLNPDARIVHARPGELLVDAVLDTGSFDFEAAEQAPGWLAALRGEPAPSDEEQGLSSFVYRARAPFHPQRFWDLLSDAATYDGVLRSKGFFWLATRMDVSGLWSHAGGSALCEAAGPWYAALPRSEWPDEPEQLEQLREDWQEPWGDRRQEIAFIGVDLDEGALGARLDAALLSEQELAAGPGAWSQLADPFPDWPGHEPAPDA